MNGAGCRNLLFEDEQERRLDELGGLLANPEQLGPEEPLHRLTVFLTYRCNLDCPYCKTIARSESELEARPAKRVSHTLASFERLLATHAGTPLRHLHFTGGEASLIPELPEMLRRARAAGVERLSLTTNGTLPASRYLALIEAGLDELRISIDAPDALLGRALTQRRRAWSSSVETLAALSAARREGANFFLIVNAVIGLANRERVVELVRFLLGFAPDDLKLITEVDARDALGSFPGVASAKAELEALIADLPPESMPLLRRKLETVFSPEAVGLETEEAPEGRRWRCYIPLTERTVDGVAYYPCSVYLREGGAPLGPLEDPPELQRQRSADFVQDTDCLQDPICRRYCLHCTRSYNARANARLA